MQLIYDHLIASIVAAMLGLSLIGQQLNNRQMAIERQSVYHAKEQSLVFGEWLEDDIVKLGARFGRARDRFQATTETIDGKPYTRQFDIYYHEDVVADDVVTRVEIRYDLVEDAATRIVAEKGATAADDVTLPVYRLVRSVRRAQYNTVTRAWVGTEPTWGVSGDYNAPYGLRYFYIEPIDSELNRVPDERSEDADYVRIEFSVIPTLFPLHQARFTPKAGLYWGTTIEIRPF